MARKNHDEAKLPKWAQKRISKMRHELDSLREHLRMTQEASRITARGHHWFTIAGPLNEKEDPYHLFWLEKNGARKACSLSCGDILLVGRRPPERIGGKER